MNKIKDILHNNELGKMKDELPNDTIIQACFLKAKAYCYNTVKREDEKKLKGITKATIKNQIILEDYKNATYGGVSKYASLSFIAIHQIGRRSLEVVRREPQTFRLLKQLN